MGLLHSNGRSGPISFLKEHEVPQPRAWRLAELALTERLPEIGRGSEGFLSAVVVVVPKRRPDVGFHLKRSQQQAVLCDNEVPLLDGPKEAWQLKVLPQEQARLGSSGFNEEFAE